MEEVLIKKCGPEDMQTIHDMAQTVFRETYKEILSPEQMEYMMEWMYSMDSLQRQLEEGHVYYMALYDGVPAGYLSVQREGTDGEGREVFHLQKIYVLPLFQGKRVGQALFDTAIGHVRGAKMGEKALMELNVNRANKAVEFYRHQGMTILRQGDFDIGEGFYMNDYIMGLTIG